MDRNYDVITFISRRPGLANLLSSSKLQLCLSKQSSKELEIACIKMQSISVFLDIAKVAHFQLENDIVSRTQGACHVIYIFYGSSL